MNSFKKQITIDFDVKVTDKNFEIDQIAQPGGDFAKSLAIVGYYKANVLNSGGQQAFANVRVFKSINKNLIDLKNIEPIRSFDKYYMLDSEVKIINFHDESGSYIKDFITNSDDEKYILKQIEQQIYSIFEITFNVNY